MKHSRLLVFFLLILGASQVSAQTKVFFDRLGKGTSESNAYYYRSNTSGNDYKSFYTNGGALYFEGKIAKPSDNDESLNQYAGNCIWYFKNGKKKFVKNYNDAGKEDGTCSYYYESGQIWKDIEYKDGNIVGNFFKEYDEDGKISRTFEENFDNNNNDWDLYTSDKTFAKIADGQLTMGSFTKEGAARYINLPYSSDEFTADLTINISKLGYNEKAGLIYGFKDWQNYNFFLISGTNFYIGTIYEGVKVMKADGMFSADIKKTEPNIIKVIGIGEKNVYSINGSINYSTDLTSKFGSNVGFCVSGKSTISVDHFAFKEIHYKGADVLAKNPNDLDVKATGSGIILSTSGYILTNNHVIEDATKIQIEINENGSPKSYYATVIEKDADNDLAILKINDDAFKPLASIDYAFIESGTADVGSSVFTIGFPYALSGMGKDAKFTDGKISSKTGYNGAINSYQTSVPIQPGNSGGPLFNDKGQLIGVMNSAIKSADNVSYGIKVNYVKNLMELLPDSPPFPNNQKLLILSTEERVKVITQYVVLIKIK